TNAFKGEDLNHYVPIFKKYHVPVLYNFKDEDMAWVPFKPNARMRVLDRIFPEGIHIPDYFLGKNIVHLPTTKCHIYTTTTGAMDYIRLAHEDRLGVGDPREIQIVGDVDAANENWQFHVGKNLVRIGGGDLIWFGPLKRFQKLFFHTPLVNGFILASDVYHDFYRWPLLDRRVFQQWCDTTAWGQLFLRYAQMGPQAQPLVDGTS